MDKDIWKTIKKLYKYDGKCHDQQQHKAIFEKSMVYTPEGFTNNSTISPGSSVPVKNISASKSIHQFWKDWM